MTLLLAAVLAGGNARAVVVRGSVFGGGNQADVKVNTTVNISAGQIEGNVYGGGNLGDVGTIDKTDDTNYNYTWTGNDADNGTIVSGLCTVTISGGTIGRIADDAVNDEDHGNVFGAGKGEASTFWCEKAMVYETRVTVSAGTVKRNVYGGGRIGRVENNTEVTIGSGAGSQQGNDAPIIGNNVFGAGAGAVTHGYSALVRGNSTVTIQGNAKVANSVYGGGELATVGKYNIAKTAEEATAHGVKIGMPYETVSGGVSTVNILGYAKIGPDESGHVFGAGKGVDPTNDTYTYDAAGETQKSSRPKRMTLKPSSLDGYIYDNTDNNRVIWEYFNDQTAYYDFLETLALVSETHVTVKGNSTVKGSVYGGSESGFVQRNTDVKIQESCIVNTTGSGQNINDGNIFGGGKGLAIFSEAGKVKGNTVITISGGTMNGSVYGGGELGDVRGTTSITMSNGSVAKNVYGGGKGLADNFTCDKAMVGVNNEGEGDLNPSATNKGTNVSITNGTVYGNVYGGGEIGRVEWNTIVTIGSGAGVNNGDAAPDIKGSVFGAGKGVETHGYSALVRGNCTVTVQGNAKIGNNVYGGGEIATVGRYWVKGIPHNVLGEGESVPSYPESLATGMPYIQRSGGVCNVTVGGHAIIGPATATNDAGHVYGAGKGVIPNYTQGTSQRYVKDQGMQAFASEAAYEEFLQTLALVTNTTVTINSNAQVIGSVYGGSENGFVQTNTGVNIQGSCVIGSNETTFGNIYGGGKGLATFDEAGRVNGNATLAISGGTVYGSIFGGGQLGANKGSVTVNVSGGQVIKDVYGGGALANTNIDDNTTTQVNLTGGTMRDVYGGGLGQVGNDPIEAKVYGNVTVELNNGVANDAKGAVVNRIFGANNLNGSPQKNITVNIYKTQNANEQRITNPIVGQGDPEPTAKVIGRYDVQAVYGGGNLAPYIPLDASTSSTATTTVLIDGCDMISINQVYGGGNAASVPASNVIVRGTFEINEVFGGGNGNDAYILDEKYYNNPGANVGYRGYTHWDPNTTGTAQDPYNPIDNTTQEQGGDASTKEARIANYRYGSGVAQTEIYAGKINSVYGGSNQKGNISTTAISIYDEMIDDCRVDVAETYGGGKNAPMDGVIQMNLDCVENLPTVYGGAKNADVNSDIVLNITNGTYTKVFGGNNQGGAVWGSITVNIKEEGCKPIVIGELYGGGDRAPYSIYGYKTVNGVLTPLEAGDNEALQTPYKDPRINVISASKIGTIYGGGYLAKVVGSPHINVNMEQGKVLNVASDYASGQDYTVHEIETITNPLNENDETYNAILEIGKIGTIFGGGNQADVIGDTYVEIGTGTWHNGANGELVAISPARNAANITGDVFGGGNGLANDVTSAKVTGNTNIFFANGTIAQSVYGGGNLAQVSGNTYVNISGGTIGTSGQGGAVYGNVYGGGKGQETANGVPFGLIAGNSNVLVSGSAAILHNIYGGGSFGSVGTYTYDASDNITGYTSGGTALVYITGTPTIGTTGQENGMVFGSSRGNVGAPDAIHDRLAWVYDSKVIIGDTINSSNPAIKGSIYGGGENGHNYHDAYVRIHAGTIGIHDGSSADATRGNVYGGGCGTDKYDSDANDVVDSYNPKAGIVLNNAWVNVTGGNILRNIYGAGAMGSVGTITNTYRHDATKTETYAGTSTTYDGAFYNFGLSWPVELVYPSENSQTYTGKTKVTVTGGTIGYDGSDNGDIYGAARGEAGDRYAMAGLANVRETQVIIGTPGQAGPEIKGSVFGGSANGHVYEDTEVQINSGTIDHSVFGGGNGDGTYKSVLWIPDTDDPDDLSIHSETAQPQDINSFTAGKVYGNTRVEINGGTVKRNVYGGGNLGSVGKGNYAGGTDDYSTTGYGELPALDNGNETALWTNTLFMGSGKATVIVNAGTIGESGVSFDDLPTGNVFGSSRGKAALDLGQRYPRYKFVPDFYLGYTNETSVTIGDNESNNLPTIYGSVYGGGQDGHVRRDAKVTINKGTIHHDVFGAGSGIGTYTDIYDNNVEKCNSTSGSVTCATQVDVIGGTINGNVYGGGALASVGAPWAGQGLPNDQYDEHKTATQATASYSYTQVNIKGGSIVGNVFGASRGPSSGLPANVTTFLNSNQYDTTKFATVLWADVNVTGAATINGSVYGGGEKGIVKHATNVNIGTTGQDGVAFTGTISNDVYGGGKEAIVGGNVTVNMNSGTVTHDVYGGGALANTNTNTHETMIVDAKTVNTSGAYNTADEVAGVTTAVNFNGGTVRAIYGGGLGDNTSNPNIEAKVHGAVTVTVDGGVAQSVFGANNLCGAPQSTVTVNINGTDAPQSPATYAIGNVYGGGNIAAYGGSPVVNMAGGYVNRIFGGGKLADVAGNVTVTVTGGHVIDDLYGGGELAHTNTGNWDFTNGTWLADKIDQSGATTYKTTVNLNGGILGDAFGGALGESNNPAYVYGDVTVTVNGAALPPVYTTETVEQVEYTTLTSGRVFGGNNIAGTPKGNVKVHVISTGSAYSISKTPRTFIERAQIYLPDADTKRYDVGAVFGGGNEADYEPTGNQAPIVIVEGCDETVVESVYGGGNAAAVPETNVTIESAYFLEYVFGGGCGSGPYNKGANVGYKTFPSYPFNSDKTSYIYGSGNTNVEIKGGYIDNSFGASDTRGELHGKPNVVISGTNSNACDLVIGSAYGGGRKTPLDHDVNFEVRCQPNEIKNIFGGSEEANIDGNVTLTLMGGKYESVFGGNKNSGTITGNITVNIQETDEGCAPIEIDNLYGGSFYAPYSGQITINLISFTHIGTVYGGSFGASATVTGNAQININQIKGSWAGETYGSRSIPDKIGEIGTVFGGGNLGKLIGNTEINIGTVQTVQLPKLEKDTDDNEYHRVKDGQGNDVMEDHTVLGAYITGNVYGGGNEADVTGNTLINISAKYDEQDTKYIPVAEGTSNVIIVGNVFGGGKGIADSFKCQKAMVGIEDENDGINDGTGKGTKIYMGNGTVQGSVYGGGEVGRVEWNTEVTIGFEPAQGQVTSAPTVQGNLFGAGKGVNTHGYSALVRGNASVTVQGNAKVGHSIYGGGEIASIGKYNVADDAYHALHPEVQVGMPYSLANNGSGYCTVIVRGNAEIGPDGMQMKKNGGPDDTGHVFGAGKGILPYEGVTGNPKRMIPGNTWQTYTENDEDDYLLFVESLALATQAEVIIGGNAFIKGSVYGGSENGHVQHDTHVIIQDNCQIGQGEGITERYTDHYGEWPTNTTGITESYAECAHWDYDETSGSTYDPYAIYEYDGKYYYDAQHQLYANGGSIVAKDGHTFYGNVFGGGSGLIPYAPGKWHYASGSVGGNSTVDITGGHILTSVYGGNELTNVGTYMLDSKNRPLIPVSGGKCTINMVGGTLGVPRTPADSKLHPVTCYLFGAGKGDQRAGFNTWTNVVSTEVNITGNARIYGSTFGGGEDGHVIRDANTTIGGSVTIGGTTYNYSEVIVGTTGKSYVDGNLFGGGRGFNGEAQTAGTVGGNVTVEIKNGTFLGSVYGGGRLASVGTQFTSPDDPDYGNFDEDETGENAQTYGHVTLTISGGTIGNNDGDSISGNVYGGSMGRLTLLDGTLNPIWPKLAQVKTAAVNIYGNPVIKRSVYGGSEFGTVRDKAYVTIGGYKTSDADENGNYTVTPVASDNLVINRDVYGGGKGSPNRTYTVFTVKEPKPGVENPSSDSDYNDATYAFTPMQFAGCVGQNAYITIVDGYIRKSVYGGGELATVGVLDCTVETVNGQPDDDRIIVDQDNNTYYIYKNMRRHSGATDFAISWPYEFNNIPAYPGDTYIKITGGRIGTTSSDDYGTDNGDVYGGGKGIAGDYKDYVFCANVGTTHINIDYSQDAAKTLSPTNYMSGGDCIAGAVYGGGENGHVMHDTKVTLVDGLIGHALYGGGSGKGKFSKKLLKIDADPASHDDKDYYTREIYSITAGKVFGNTDVEMRGGYVIRNVFGGGTLGSVGKGNYAGGADDYSESGYGEITAGNLWDSVSVNSQAFLSTGISTVKIYGGTVGYIDYNNPDNYIKDGLPYGNVFGGCRGESAPNIVESPRYLYCPEFYLGYVNETRVIIGLPTADQGANYVPPVINGSVYGGGQDGHVRRDASVIINNGTIGRLYNGDGTDLDNPEWLYTGNVFGAGSGISKYKYDFNYDNDFDDQVTYNGRATKEQDYSTSAGSVTRYTKVIINGGTIRHNVYGGGSLASVGAPNLGQGYDEYRKGDTETGHGVGKQSLNEIIINGGQIGGTHSYDQDDNHIYGGYVYGASRGQEGLPANFATSLWTSVTINGGNIVADVFGGGEVGAVKCGVDVNMLGGTIEHSIYGGGALANTNTSNWDNANDDWKAGMITTSGKRVTKYNTRMNILGGVIGGEAYGGALGRLANSSQTAVAAMVYGDITLNLNGLEKADYDINPTLFEGKLDKVDNNTYRVKDPFDEAVTLRGATVHKIYGANNLNGTPKGHVKVHVFATQHKDESRKNIAVKYPKHPVQNDKQHIDETLGDYLGRLSAVYTNETAPAGLVTAISAAISANGTYSTTESESDKTALDNAIASMNTELGKLYDMEAVYGGGNLAEYVWGNGATIDKDATNLVEAARTEVIIEGCDYTSIKQIYGGGNAASTSGTFVEIRSTYEIDEVFGGGNGADNYYLIEGDNTMWYENPGANVGYHNYTYADLNSGEGSQTNPYKSVDNDDAMSADMRKANYAYGSGIATTEIRGGTAHNVYGGSNKKGNISTTALSVYEEADDECPIEINETYGGGKDAAMDGEIELSLDCVKDMDMIFGGAKNADVYNNVTLNITNGHYGKVFGGNNTGGALYGTITVNIEEKGCVPIIIDELYGGGYLAPYSKFGYEKDANGNYIYYQVDEENRYKKDNNGNYIIGNIDNGKLVPLEAKSQQSQYEHDPETSKDLRINIISATRIGTVYGGGYKAKVVADPYVNINMQNGKQQIYEKVIGEETKYVDVDYKVNHKTDYVPDQELTETYDDEGETKYRYFIPLDEGNIGTVFGGGFLADVAGDTHIEIGTGTWVTGWNNDGTPVYSTYSEGVRNKAVITGDVFGGGDNADVTGNTNIHIANGHIYFNVYGGGKMGSVGTITSETKHTNVDSEFALSWPYEFVYKTGTGNTNITVTGGRLGFTGKDNFELVDGYWRYHSTEKLDPVPAGIKRLDNGDIYGGGQGQVADRYDEAHIANVNNTTIIIDSRVTPDIDEIVYNTSGTNIDAIAGSVYGGAEDGHVIGNTSLTIRGGIIGHSVYGGGKGKGTYEATILKWKGLSDDQRKAKYFNSQVIEGKTVYTMKDLSEIDAADKEDVDINSLTAGKVYGNATISMTGGRILRNIYGGGNLGSLGKGNYAGGTDDYTRYAPNGGYGEKINSELWTPLGAFMTSGKATITVTGGTIGTVNGFKDDLPTGNIFGGCRGISVPNVPIDLLPRYVYCPEFYLGYVNEATVTVGTENQSNDNAGQNGYAPRIYGSVYGGGQDGHVRRETKVTVYSGEIGNAYTTENRKAVGTLANNATDEQIADHSDISNTQWLHRGNVMGAGSGIGKYDSNGDKTEDTHSTAAGSVTHNTTVNIYGGIIYHNVYGGGSLASVGPPYMGHTENGVRKDPDKGNKDACDGLSTLSIVNIMGKVGDETSFANGYGGDVFGASRGADAEERLHLEENKTYATSFYDTVSIKTGAYVLGNVFGGGEAGLVLKDAGVYVEGAHVSSTKIGHDLFGGGDEADVNGNTFVTISGGHIMHNVYGGGNMGSVGTIERKVVHNTKSPASDGALYDFGLSWPVELVYKSGTGDTHVTMTGGRIGTSGDDNGDIFGASKGKIGIDWAGKNIDLAGTSNTALVIGTMDAYRYEEAELANVNNTYIKVNFASPANLNTVARAQKIWDVDDQEIKPKVIIDATYEGVDQAGHFTAFGETNVITGSVYGGSEDGHVIGNTEVIITDGIIGHAIYGGGKGKGTYQGRLYNLKNHGELNGYVDDIYSLTAGKVYGNTHIIMENGYVIRNVFGGGNLGSIGKGNYAGGQDDYSTIGYGERAESDESKLWEKTNDGDMADNFINSGKTLVEIRGGQIGAILTNGTTADIEKVARKDGLPTGNVFGACRGQASPNGNVSPRYLYIPDFFLGYVNETSVIIGTDTKQPKILGSVYGGGQDGHVRRNTNVVINQGEIGITYSTQNINQLGKSDLTNLQWKDRGNVFGAGSGVGSYTVRDANTGLVIKSLVADDKGNYPDSIDYNYSSGSVTCETNVEINELAQGKTIIHQNIYGGGSLASVGPPNTGQGFAEFNTTEPYNRTPASHKSTTSSNVTINGGTIGDKASYAANYGGNVFGASRGNLEGETKLNLGENASRYASTIWTNVEAKNGHIFGNVFGGGESGSVTKDSKVVIGGASSGSPVQSRNARPQATQAEPQTQPASVQSPTRNAATEAPQNRSVTTRQAAAQ